MDFDHDGHMHWFVTRFQSLERKRASSICQLMLFDPWLMNKDTEPCKVVWLVGTWLHPCPV